MSCLLIGQYIVNAYDTLFIISEGTSWDNNKIQATKDVQGNSSDAIIHLNPGEYFKFRYGYEGYGPNSTTNDENYTPSSSTFYSYTVTSKSMRFTTGWESGNFKVVSRMNWNNKNQVEWHLERQTTDTWYLSGTINGVNTGKGSNDYKFTKGSNAYTYSLTYTSNGSDQYFTVNNNSLVYQCSTSDGGSGTAADACYWGKDDWAYDNSQKWKIPSSSVPNGTPITVTWNNLDRTLSWSTVTPNAYYLTGLLNGASETGNTHQFTNTSGSTWTYSFSPSADQGGYQYMTIKKSDGTAYHPANHNSGSGTAGTTTDTDPSADNKWRVAAVSGQTVNLTWDSSTNVLSWTVSGGSSSGTLTDYKVLYGTSSSISGLSELSGAIVYDLGNGSYSVNFSSFLGKELKNLGEYYIAISKSSNYTDILGGGSQADNPKGTCEVKEGSNFFATTQMQKNDASGNTYYYSHIKLINNPNGLKYVVTPSGYTVDYDFYASGKAYDDGTGDDTGDDTTTVDVYAKDGAAPINWNNKGSGGASAISGTAYNYAAIATTTISKIDGSAPTSGTVTTVNVGDASSQYQTAKVDAGKSIEITTTIAESNSWREKYYVKGWCINGVTYKCDGTVGVNAESDTASGVCTMTYTIPTSISVEYLEITPIYYIKSVWATSNNLTQITFYLEGYNTVQSKWGNTPFIYPFYGNLNNVDNAFGVYPGQPMVYANGQYSVEIPVNDNVPIKNSPSKTAIKGITISNGYADHVHRNLIYGWTAADNDAAHKQTYDYDDFYKIYNECLKNGNEHPNSIIFRIQDENKVFNRSKYGGGKSGQFASGTDAITISDIETNGNGWELLTNRYGEAVNIFGSTAGITSPSADVDPKDDTANAIYVVSTGYNANIAGDYGTMWKIYNGSGNLITSDSTNSRYGVPPSILLLRGSASGYDAAVKQMNYPSANHSVTGVGSYTDDIYKYETLYKTLKGVDYVGKRVYITYEQDAQDTRNDSSGTGAYRLDGQWFYTHASDYVQSSIEIEYWDNATGKWVTDTVNASTGVGSTSKCTAAFDSDSYKSDSKVTTSSQKRIMEGKSWNFTATAAPGYMFDSWQIKYSDTSYDEMKGAGAAASINATANYHLVARFVPVVTGSLTIDHTLSGSSTGEGSVDMEVKVYDGSNVLQTYTGTHIYIDGTYISNENKAYKIEVCLKATPQYDGKVSAFGYDKFNTANSITPTTTPAALPGAENIETTSTFEFTVEKLYAGTTLATSALTYTSTIDETPHYYNFLYEFTDRAGDNKSYTAKGVISLKDYKQYVTNASAYVLSQDYLVAKAPFESNFLKSNTLRKGTISYNSSTHTFGATSTFTQTDSIPTHHVLFKLPYDYYSESGTSYKKYTKNSDKYNAGKEVIDLVANYNTFVTVDSTETAVDSDQSTGLSKVTDPADINHTGNRFITAPDELMDNSKKMYFKYWEIKRGSSTGSVVARIYYPDFNYRIYSNYYVEAVYSANPSDSWHMNYLDDAKTTDCSIMYLGDSRNQWNASSGSFDDSSTASDKIYNDFIFKYSNNGRELKGDTDVKIGMVIERVANTENTGWAIGSDSVTDMSSYKNTYGSTESSKKSDIAKWIISRGTTPKGCIKKEWNTNDLNNKNFMEQSYYFYSQYGQKEENNTISYANDSSVDNYVYRAYAYILYTDSNSTTACKVSDPAYFCMKYTSSLKYSE